MQACRSVKLQIVAESEGNSDATSVHAPGSIAGQSVPTPGSGIRRRSLIRDTLFQTPDNLRIAENVPLILPLHPALDRAREAARGDRKIGTTGRGIGPAYEDKVARRAIRLCDLAEPDTLSAKLDELLLNHNTLLQGLGAETFTKDVLLAELLDFAPRLLPFAEPVWERLDARC